MILSRYTNLERSFTAGYCDSLSIAANKQDSRVADEGVPDGYHWYRELACNIFGTSKIPLKHTYTEAEYVEKCRELCINFAEEICNALNAKIRELSVQYDTTYQPTVLWAYFFDELEDDRSKRISDIDVGYDDNAIAPEFILAMLFDQIDTSMPMHAFGVTLTNLKSGAVSRVAAYLSVFAEIGVDYIPQVKEVQVYPISGPSVRHMREEVADTLSSSQYVGKLTILTGDTSIALRTLSASFGYSEYDKVDFPEYGRHPLEVRAAAVMLVEKAKRQDKPIIVTTMSSTVCDCICTENLTAGVELVNIHAHRDGSFYRSVAGSTGEFAHGGVATLSQSAADVRAERLRSFARLPDAIVARHNAEPLNYSKITLNNQTS